jgi:DNA-binding protein HU-beta
VSFLSTIAGFRVRLGPISPTAPSPEACDGRACGPAVQRTFSFARESYLSLILIPASNERLKVMAAHAKTTAAKTSRPVTLKHLAASLAEQHELTKRQGETLLNELVGLITKHLKKGERIRIAGFGILQVRKRAARMGRNPATGEAIKIKASKKVAFRPSKELKLAI